MPGRVYSKWPSQHTEVTLFFHVSLSHLPPAEHFPSASLCQCQVHELRPPLTALTQTGDKRQAPNPQEMALNSYWPLCYLSTIIKCFSSVGSSVPRGVLLHFRLVDNEDSEKLYYILRKRRKIPMFPRRNPKPFLLPCCHLVTNPAPAPKTPKLASNRSNF